MALIRRFRQLGVWAMLGVVGSVASIVSLFAMFIGSANSQQNSQIGDVMQGDRVGDTVHGTKSWGDNFGGDRVEGNKNIYNNVPRARRARLVCERLESSDQIYRDSNVPIKLNIVFKNAGDETAHITQVERTFDIVRIPSDERSSRILIGKFEALDSPHGDRRKVGPGAEYGSGAQVRVADGWKELKSRDRRLRYHGLIHYADGSGDIAPEGFCFELYMDFDPIEETFSWIECE